MSWYSCCSIGVRSERALEEVHRSLGTVQSKQSYLKEEVTDEDIAAVISKPSMVGM